MAEDDIKKTIFMADSSGLCKFTHMPFCLTDAGSSFCRLMEQFLGDQQFVTLLLHLVDICIFAPDNSKLAISQLKNFILSPSWISVTFPSQHNIFRVTFYQLIEYLPSQERWIRWETGWFQRMPRNYIHSLAWYLTSASLFPTLPKWPWVSPINWSDQCQENQNKKIQLHQPQLKRIKVHCLDIWTSDSFWCPKNSLDSICIAAYGFTKEFILVTITSIKGLGTLLSLEDDSGKVHIISYVSKILQPSKWSMCNYSSAKLELLA